MNIFSKFKKLFSNSGNMPKSLNKQTTMSMTERESKVYGEDKLSVRRMYEKWAGKDHWLLFGEAIPLLFGIEPGINLSKEDQRNKEIKDLGLHAKDCVNKKLLPIVNSEKKENEWQVRPVDLYRWATVSRISVPSELNDLMQFVMATVKATSVDSESAVAIGVNDDVDFLKHREIILGAAMSLLANSPDSCVNRKGNIKSDQIASRIMENEKQWFGEEKSLLSESAVSDLIEQYLSLARPIL